METKMKDTSIVAPIFECSGCKYWSLNRSHTSSHITKKCPEAKIVSKKKIIKHQDPNNERDDVATLYQCSKCSYTSYQPSPVNTHIKKCPGAELIKEQRKLFIEDVPPEGIINNQNMTNNTGNVGSMATTVNGTAIGTFNLNVQLIMPAVNSQEEYDDRVRIMLRAIKDIGIESKIDIAFADGEFKPVELLKALETENPQLDNKKLTNNSVVCLKSGEKTPLKDFCRQEIVNLNKVSLDTIKRTGLEDELTDTTAQRLKPIIDACIDDKQISAIKYCLKNNPKLDLTTEERKSDREIVRSLAKCLKEDPDFEKNYYNETFVRALQNLETPLTTIKQQNIRKEKKWLKNKQSKNYVEKVEAIAEAEDEKTDKLRDELQKMADYIKTKKKSTNEVK